MKSLHILASLAVFCCLAGCAKEETVFPGDEPTPEDGVIVLQERDKSCPLTDYANLIAESPETRAGGVLTLEDFIGHSYRLKQYPYESAENLGLTVIDMARYKADNSDYEQSVPFKFNDQKRFAFSGFERCETKMQYTNTVSTGFKLDFIIFSIGSKNTYKEVFNSTDIQLRQNVFGELHVKFYDRIHELSILISQRKDVGRKYLAKSFLDRLYYVPTAELIEAYGGFVLTKFLSGAKLVALFNGVYNEEYHSDSSQREIDLETEIKGAFVKNTADSAQFSVGRGDGSEVSKTKKFTNIQFSLCAFGGLSPYYQFTPVENINSVVYDLSAWSASLGDTANLTIAELPEGALIPITDLIEEENLKAKFYEYYATGTVAPTITALGEPYVYLFNPGSALMPTHPFSTYLVTRYGEKILLKSAKVLTADYRTYAQQETERMRKIFPSLSIVAGYPPRSIGPWPKPETTIDDIVNFDAEHMTKFVDPETGKIYLLTTVVKDGKKTGFTLYDSNVVNDYVFGDLIRSLPVAAGMTIKTIQNQYYLIAL